MKKKVLIVGNSMSGVLYRAIKTRIYNGPDFSPSFFVVSGGTGPYLKMDGDSMQLIMQVEGYPAYSVPAEVEKLPVNYWDVIVISALGYVDGGFAYKNPISFQGLAAEYDPVSVKADQTLVSEACLTDIVAHGLRQQYGVGFMLQLRKVYRGRIVIQPFPLLSAALKDRDDWILGAMYRDRLSAHRFLCSARDQAMVKLCAEAGAELLDLPDPSWRTDGFTPIELSGNPDCIHPSNAYGAMVIRQIADHLCNEPDPAPDRNGAA